MRGTVVARCRAVVAATSVLSMDTVPTLPRPEVRRDLPPGARVRTLAAEVPVRQTVQERMNIRPCTVPSRRLPASAAELAARTPGERDRTVDLLRVVSIGVVVLGHWLMAAVVVGADGSVTVGNAVASAPGLAYATWFLQVVPVFFLVGGFAHARALRRPKPYADFVRGRVARLLPPVAVFAGVWTVLAALAGLAGVDRGVVSVALRTVPQPLWFLGVYLGVVGLAPVMLRLHRRHGVAVPLVLASAAVAVDVARFGSGVPLGPLNLAFVWLAVHQLGFFLSDGLTRRAGMLLAGGGFGALVLLTAFGPYPTSMVGLPGDPVSNVGPPTVALLAQAVMLAGLVVLARPALARWCAHRRVWTAVVAANGVVMTVFLWHLTALFALTALTLDAAPAPGSAAWWVSRPLWIVACGLLLVPLVALFRAAERPRPVPAGGASWVAALGVAATALGTLALSATGLSGLLTGHTATLVVLPVTASAALYVMAAGTVTTLAGRRPRSR